MLPEWAGRKAALTPSLADQVDETAPIPVVAPVAAPDEPAHEADEIAGVDLDNEPDPTADLARDDTQQGDFAHSSSEPLSAQTTEDQDLPRAGRSGRLLLLLALLALVAGIAAGYLYLVLTG